MAVKKEVYATKKNMDELYPRYHDSLVMYSPYTGEQYSADPGDYWEAASSRRFKDRTGHIMRLVVRGGVQLSIPKTKRVKHPRR